MGKVPRKRTIRHLPAMRKTAKVENGEKQDSEMMVDSSSQIPVHLPDSGMFSGLDIDVTRLAKLLPGDSDDRQSVVSFRSSYSKAGSTAGEKKMKKKDKLKLRHSAFIQKIQAIQEQKLKERNAKKRRQTAVVGDMRPLVDSLPTLVSLDDEDVSKKLRRTTNVPIVSTKSTRKFRTRQNEMLRDIALFKQILRDPSYRADPVNSMLEHTKNKLREE